MCVRSIPLVFFSDGVSALLPKGGVRKYISGNMNTICQITFSWAAGGHSSICKESPNQHNTLSRWVDLKEPLTFFDTLFVQEFVFKMWFMRRDWALLCWKGRVDFYFVKCKSGFLQFSFTVHDSPVRIWNVSGDLFKSLYSLVALLELKTKILGQKCVSWWYYSLLLMVQVFWLIKCPLISSQSFPPLNFKGHSSFLSYFAVLVTRNHFGNWRPISPHLEEKPFRIK